MPEKWIHINTKVGDPWILPIWSAVNEAENSGNSIPISKEVKSQLGLSVSTRLDMLPRIVGRMGKIPIWPHSRSWGDAPSGGIGLVVVFFLVLLVLGESRCAGITVSIPVNHAA